MAPTAGRPWILSIPNELVKTTRTDSDHSSLQPSIHRVPSNIRDLKPSRYNYSMLPLGLYNRDFTKGSPIDELKLEVLKAFLKHVNLLNKKGWSTFCDGIAGPKALGSFYDNPPDDTSLEDRVVKGVLTMDAVFVAALSFRYYIESFPDHSNDTGELQEDLRKILTQPSTRASLHAFDSDIWILENQIPLLLIGNVFEKITPKSRVFEFEEFLSERVHRRAQLLGLPHRRSIGCNLHLKSSCDHLLACLHKVVCLETLVTATSSSEAGGFFEKCDSTLISFLIGSKDLLWKALTTMGKNVKSRLANQTSSAQSDGWRSLRTVSQLQKSGIKIRGKETSVTDIQLVKSMFGLKATIYLPTIKIHDSSEIQLLNLCAYETMSGKTKKLMAYMQIMDDLIDTEEDVRLLTRGSNPVIVSRMLGNDKLVAELFNSLLQNFPIDVDSDLQHLKEVMTQIHRWDNSRWRHQFAHFSDRFVIAPWYVITISVATLILVAAILQTVYTVLGFYKR